DYETLEEAVLKLLKQGATDICLCLLAGDHKLTQYLDIQPATEGTTHVSITGCGRSSRLNLNSRTGLFAQGLGAFTLRDLSIFAQGNTPNPILIEGCREVNIIGCLLRQYSDDATELLTIGNAEARITIENNWIESRPAEGQPSISPAIVIADAIGDTAIIN